MGLSRSIEVSRDTLGVYRGVMGYARSIEVSLDTQGVRFHGIL